MKSNILTELTETLEQRKSADADSSYVASLHAKGLNKILKKVGEESIETIIAAKNAVISGNKQDLIHEAADLWFHTLVMLSHLDLGPNAVLNELAKRFDLSGLEEKANRSRQK